MGGFMVGGSVFLSLQGRQIFKNAPYEQGYLLRGRSARSANYSRSYRVKKENFGAAGKNFFIFHRVVRKSGQPIPHFEENLMLI